MAREIAIRGAVRPLAVSAAGEAGARVIEEFWTPASHQRADLAAVGRDLHAYEIKSSADTLQRLPSQIAAFSRIFDRCTAVVATKHEAQTMELIPDWWGLVVVDGDPDLSLNVRRAGKVNRNVEVELVVRLLWKEEASKILKEHDLQPNPLGGRSAMWAQLLASLHPSVICESVRNALRTREHWRGQQGRPRLSPVPVSAR